MLDMGPESNEAALVPALDRTIFPSTVPALEELIAPFELAYRLLPGRTIRHLSVPSVLEDLPAIRLAGAITTARRPLESLHLHTYSFDTLERTLPVLLQATPRLSVLSLDFIEIRNQPTLERLNSPAGIFLFTSVPHLARLHLRFTFRSGLLQEDHQVFLDSFKRVCPKLGEITLSSMLRGESVTYARARLLGGGEKWEKVKVVARNEWAFYAAHG
ncbi:hypothetical protein CALCODRAFT_503836 [Calocera cornea HHB12733]|uniref:Uncharacterized protein n=1 Tax=Calocera cornea HHB12733 TaxID=1353952 RepID=A0A165CQ38_9BASI|nr:hypothetical protein CALCODRAFT_503836 [Calocera cornea HHB12733]